MSRSDLCDYSDVYIVVKGTIDLVAAAGNEIYKAGKNVAFKNSAPFRPYILKINSTLIDNAEDLDKAMLIYNLLEYSQNYSMTSERWYNYYKGKIDNINDNASDGKSFKHRTKMLGKTEAQPGNERDADRSAKATPNVEFTIPLNYRSNFWRFLDLPLINCEIEFDLSCTKECVLIEHHNNITGVNVIIASNKLYVPVAILSINDNIKFFKNIKQRF